MGRRAFAAVLVAVSAVLVCPAAPASAEPTQPSLYGRMRAESAALEDLAQSSLEDQQRAAVVGRDTAGAQRAYRDALARQERAADQAREWARTAYMAGPDPALLGGVTGADAAARSDDLAGAAADLRHAEKQWEASATEGRRLAIAIAADRNAVAVRTDNLRKFRAANAVLIARQQARAAALDMATYRSRVAAGILVDGSAGPVARTALAAVRVALAQVGKPYVFGAEGPLAFDCSGLVQYAYRQAGVGLPRTARPQFRATRPVPPSQLVPGDLLFFATDKSNWDTIHHVGIYLGGGRMVHAPEPGDVVKVAPVWWAEYFGATRVVWARG
ncbi:MAG TPA: C40 family peptidase [Mycobacteriales bacterium]